MTEVFVPVRIEGTTLGKAWIVIAAAILIDVAVGSWEEVPSVEVAADLVQTARLTVRDSGRVLRLSHQRTTQLIKAASRTAKRSQMGVALALLALADPRAIAAPDHAGTCLDDLHPVVLHVVIRLKIRANQDASGAST